MAADGKKSTLASQFTGLPMKALIGAPLKAATDANAMIARSQTQFLLSTCFEPNPQDKSKLKPIMVSFQIERQIINSDGKLASEAAVMDISIPLLTIIPINSLAIETLKISFEMEVKSSREFNKETEADRDQRSNEKRLQHGYKSHEFDTELHGTLCNKSQGSKQTSAGASYEVSLTAGQLPLPKGVTAILDIFTKNLTPMPQKTGSGENEHDKSS